MRNNFDLKLKHFEDELLALKQYKLLSTDTLTTKSFDFSLTFNMEIYGQFEIGVRSDKYAKLSIQTTDGTTPIGAVYFDIQDDEGRSIYTRKVVNTGNPSDHADYLVNVIDYNNNDDLQTLMGGGTVELTYNAVFVCTSDVTINITYEDLYAN